MGYPRPRDYYKSSLHQQAIDKMDAEGKKKAKEHLKQYDLSLDENGKIIDLRRLKRLKEKQ